MSRLWLKCGADILANLRESCYDVLVVDPVTSVALSSSDIDKVRYLTCTLRPEVPHIHLRTAETAALWPGISLCLLTLSPSLTFIMPT